MSTAATNASLAALSSRLADLEQVSNKLGAGDMGMLIFMMQLGFLLLETGTVQSKNAKSAMFKNLVDTALTSLIWYTFGYYLSGASVPIGGKESSAGTIRSGGSNVLPDSPSSDLVQQTDFFLSYGFAVAAITIVSGSVLARVRLPMYSIFTFLTAVWSYPMLAYWMWSAHGFLYSWGVIDVAGGGVVHLFGGTNALLMAYIVGPRHGRFRVRQGRIVACDITPHNTTYQVMGSLILWIGWFAFNASAVFSTSSFEAKNILLSLSTQNTLLAASAAFLCSFLRSQFHPRADLIPSLESALTALAAITSCCSIVRGWAAIIIGVTSAILCNHFKRLLIVLKIDDPVSASPVHFVGGALGMIMTGLFSDPELVKLLKGEDNPSGIFFPGDGVGVLLGQQAVAVLVIVAWASVNAMMFSLACSYLCSGIGLRYPVDTQIRGIDNILHGGVGYPDFMLVIPRLRASSPSKRKRPGSTKSDPDAASVGVEIADGEDVEVGLHTVLDEADKLVSEDDADVPEQSKQESQQQTAERQQGNEGKSTAEMSERLKGLGLVSKLHASIVSNDELPVLPSTSRSSTSPSPHGDSTPELYLDAVFAGSETRRFVVLTGVPSHVSPDAIRSAIDAGFKDAYNSLIFDVTRHNVGIEFTRPLSAVSFAGAVRSPQFWPTPPPPAAGNTDAPTAPNSRVFYSTLQNRKDLLAWADNASCLVLNDGTSSQDASKDEDEEKTS